MSLLAQRLLTATWHSGTTRSLQILRDGFNSRWSRSHLTCISDAAESRAHSLRSLLQLLFNKWKYPPGEAPPNPTHRFLHFPVLLYRVWDDYRWEEGRNLWPLSRSTSSQIASCYTSATLRHQTGVCFVMGGSPTCVEISGRASTAHKRSQPPSSPNDLSTSNTSSRLTSDLLRGFRLLALSLPLVLCTNSACTCGLIEYTHCVQSPIRCCTSVLLSQQHTSTHEHSHNSSY